MLILSGWARSYIKCTILTKENRRWMCEANNPGAPKVMVWNSLLRDLIVGPYFVYGNVNQHSTVMEFLYDMPPNKRIRMWIQQNGTTTYYSLPDRQELNEMFGLHWVGRGGPQSWPPRSPNLIPLHFFLWRYHEDAYIAADTCCHPGCSETETLGHVLGFCNKGELLRNNRHHRARTAIGNLLRNRGWEVHEEIHCVSEDDSHRRVDIIAINRRTQKAMVLDPTICFERDTNQALQINDDKRAKYVPCLRFTTGMLQAYYLERGVVY
ncbi:hypothetical protein ANN_10172 [Periplaneta americana]|uniref:Reverse transcriptase n=1 Tax=Periplaneta americana TaxID=6978 RepID=A0ABQ8TRF7_PERAM|nr:hypothetical protein ANN_10172 [Periplaneta americana]